MPRPARRGRIAGSRPAETSTVRSGVIDKEGVEALLERITRLEAEEGTTRRLADALAEASAAVKFRDRPGARALADRAIAVASGLGYDRGVASGLVQRCHCDVYLGRHAEALDAGERAVVAFCELAEPEGLARALIALSSVHGLRGSATESLELAALAVDVAEQHGDPVCLGWALNRLGNALALLGDLAQAARVHDEARVLLERAGDRLGDAVASENLGKDVLDAGDPARALPHLEHAFALQHEIAPESTSLVEGWIGEAHLALGSTGAAVARLVRAVDTARAAGEQAYEASLLAALARALRSAGSASDARDSAGAALAVARTVGGYEPEIEALTVTGELDFDAGRDADAVEALRHAARVGSEHGLLGFATRGLDVLSRELERRGRHREALAALREATVLHRRIASVDAVGAPPSSEGIPGAVRELVESWRADSGIVPICAYCHAVRTGSGRWQRIEAFLGGRLHARCSHGMCPDCATRVERELADDARA